MSSTIRVLHVSAAAERGGVETVLLNILKSLDTSRVTSEVVLLEDGPFTEDLRKAGVSFHVINAGRVRQVVKGGATVRMVARLLRDRGFHVVHNYNAKAQIYGGAAATIAGVPSIFHLHGIPRFSLSADGLVSLLSVTTPTSRTLACSDYVAQGFKRAWRSTRRVLVIHNGLTPSTTSPGAGLPVRERLDIASDSLVVLMPGRLHHGKGVHVFLDAAARVIAQEPRARFVIVGGALFGLEQGYELELRRQVDRLGLTNLVRLVGFQADIWPFYAAADLVVHCATEPEAFGMVVLEAMSCGRPVIAANAGGPTEIIQNGVSGILVPPNDAAQLARAIVHALCNPGETGRMALAGAVRARALFSANEMVQKLQDVYEELVAAKGDGMGRHP